MVCQKLNAALATLYLLPSASADRCVSAVAAALCDGLDKFEGVAVESPPLHETLPLLESSQLLMLIRFCNALAEEGCEQLLREDKK